MANRKGRIENWHEVKIGKNIHIHGNVYECERFVEGEDMVTSPIVKYHTIFGQSVVQTYSGSMYHLGKPAEEVLTFAQIWQKGVQAIKEEANGSN